ncbi:hypothetical protein LCGC14_0403700, partial [marine sediment metagenome]
GGYIYTGGGNIYTGGGYIYTGGGYIDTGGGNIYTGGLYIPLTFDYSKIGKLTCDLIRFDLDGERERGWWIEKCHCFGFPEMVNIVKKGCIAEIQKNLSKLPKSYRKKVLECELWTKIERASLKSWFEGGLKEEKIG